MSTIRLHAKGEKKNNNHSKLGKKNPSRLPSEKRKCLNVNSRYQGKSNPHTTGVQSTERGVELDQCILQI